MIPVTCAIVDGLLQVVVIGDYDFEEVKRAISCASGRSSADTERADQLHTLALGPLERDPGEGRRADVRLDRDSTTSELMATLLCTCGHRRETHRYETRRKAWTICRVCRCVRFTAQGADERKLIPRRD